MPELPDVELYVEHLRRRLIGARFERARIRSPNLLRSVTPPLESTYGHVVRGVRRLGKRIVVELDDGRSLVLHLMIAGRLKWTPAEDPKARAPIKGRTLLAAFDFSSGTLTLTEASTRQRASLMVAEDGDTIRALDPGGIEVLDASLGDFSAALRRESHTLKRSLTDPRILSGIGNAYSDEILHRARLSPLQLTSRLTDAEIQRLFEATRATLIEWRDRLLDETGDDFPKRVTAFRPAMAVHGKWKQPCPDCGAPVQRIVYAENETNYCARCQTGGRLLADRARSRLLRDDWPRTLEEMEELTRNLGAEGVERKARGK
jgi:formamidopyrimidine-DNA glycosylase